MQFKLVSSTLRIIGGEDGERWKQDASEENNDDGLGRIRRFRRRRRQVLRNARPSLLRPHIRHGKLLLRRGGRRGFRRLPPLLLLRRLLHDLRLKKVPHINDHDVSRLRYLDGGSGIDLRAPPSSPPRDGPRQQQGHGQRRVHPPRHLQRCYSR